MKVLLATALSYLANLLTSWLASSAFLQRTLTMVDPMILCLFVGPITISVVLILRRGSLPESCASSALSCSLIFGPSIVHKSTLLPNASFEIWAAASWWVFLPGMILWAYERERPTESDE